MFLWKSHIDFRRGWTNLHTHQQCIRTPLCVSLHKPFFVCRLHDCYFLWMAAFLTGVKQNLSRVLICISQMGRIANFPPNVDWNCIFIFDSTLLHFISLLTDWVIWFLAHCLFKNIGCLFTLRFSLLCGSFLISWNPVCWMLTLSWTTGVLWRKFLSILACFQEALFLQFWNFRSYIKVFNAFRIVLCEAGDRGLISFFCMWLSSSQNYLPKRLQCALLGIVNSNVGFDLGSLFYSTGGCVSFGQCCASLFLWLCIMDDDTPSIIHSVQNCFDYLGPLAFP